MSQQPKVYHLQGVIDTTNATAIKKEVETFIDQAAQPIEISLAGLQSHNSLVVGLMMSWMRYAHRHQVKLVFSHVPDRLFNIIEFSGLTGTLPIVDAEQAAGEHIVE